MKDRMFMCDICSENKSIEMYKCTLNSDHGVMIVGYLTLVSEGRYTKDEFKCPFCY